MNVIRRPSAIARELDVAEDWISLLHERQNDLLDTSSAEAVQFAELLGSLMVTVIDLNDFVQNDDQGSFFGALDHFWRIIEGINRSEYFADVKLQAEVLMKRKATKITREVILRNRFPSALEKIETWANVQELAFNSRKQTLSAYALKSNLHNREQRPSAVQFAFERGQLVVQRQQPIVPEPDARNIEAAQNALRDQGTRLLDALLATNSDRRLVSIIDDLCRKVSEGTDVIQLGLLNMTAVAAVEEFADELPTHVAVLAKGYTRFIDMYLAQFPEWARFAGNAAAVAFSDEDVRRLKEAATSLLAGLSQAGSRVSPEVPHSIQFLRSMIDDPRNASSQALMAMIGTIENLGITVYAHLTSFVDQSLRKTADVGSTAVAKTMGAVMVVLVFQTLTPVLPKVPGMDWLEIASKHVQRLLVTD